MAQLISEIWDGLRGAGLPEVMLYLADNSASRCHWDDTTLINGVRVALLADQDRQIVRLLPVDSCVGIGIASPKGTDPSGYKRVIFNKLVGVEDAPDKDAGPAYLGPDALPAAPPTVAAAAAAPPPPAEPAAPRADTTTSRFGPAMRSASGAGARGAFGAR